MRELAQGTVKTSITVARHIFRYLTYQMRRGLDPTCAGPPPHRGPDRCAWHPYKEGGTSVAR
jgi:hypothetical protein